VATVGNLDFKAHVRNKKSKRAGGARGGGHAYAYVSDHNTRVAFEKLKPVELAVAAAVRMFKAVGRNELLGSAVKVGPKQFPRVHALVTRCAETLGIATPTVYVRSRFELNAATYGTNDDAFILLNSALIDHFSDEELLSIIGHECGHIHNNHVVYLTAMYFLSKMASVFVRWIATPALLALNAWSRRAEISCDRAAMLCARDLEVATRSLAKLAVGSTKLYEQLNLEAFVAQYEEGREGVGQIAEALVTHPWLPKRVKALRVFADSRVFREHVGGSGGLSMEEVDARVHEIIKVVGS
jgi:Zn-dependent protease with chaperone function